VIDTVLLAGRLLFVALLYLFLFIAIKTGVGLVKGQRTVRKTWTLEVVQGPRELQDVKLRVDKPLIVGRHPDADIVIGAGYVSAHHARFSPIGPNLEVEDLGSTNGTLLNNQPIVGAAGLHINDIVNVGDVAIKVGRE
jgi:hypothetical protein